MIKSVLKTSLAICAFAAFTACSENNETTDSSQESEETVQEVSEPEEEVEESPFGNLAELVGEWTVDAATAGIKMDLTFGEDGSFTQSMGPVQGAGTWKRVDDEHVNIVTQNTNAEGQTWKVSGLTDTGVNLTWNPGEPKEKTIPMTRVQ
jgi:hypothetical protein